MEFVDDQLAKIAELIEKYGAESVRARLQTSISRSGATSLLQRSTAVVTAFFTAMFLTPW